MVDLYKVLDVPIGADKATIRKAYRNKSKKAHPDGGGTPEKFALVKTAHDILTDDSRRDHYDRTGEFTEKEPDNVLAEVIKFISMALDMVLYKAHQNHSLDYITSVDVVGNMVNEIKDFHKEAEAKEREMNKGIAVNQKLLKRFKRKHKSNEPNLFEAMISSRIRSFQEQIAGQKKIVETSKRALEMLSEYEFEKDVLSSEQNRQAGYSILTSALSGIRL